MRHLFSQVDQWARDLSRVRYAALLGAFAAIGVLAVSLLLGEELSLVQAFTMGVVMFALEYTLGRFQTSGE